MANYIIQDTTLIAIADSIRAKTGSNETMLPSDMPTAIEGITGGADGCATVTFMNGSVELLSRPVYIGDDCPDPVEQGRIEIPTKESTVDTVYTHNGWAAQDGSIANDEVLKNITEDRTLYAAYASAVRTYTVRFFDGDTLLKTEQLPYGGSSDYAYKKEGYVFLGFTPSPTNITGDLDCYASFEEAVDFANASWDYIASVSAAGQAQDTFAIGDTKTIPICLPDTDPFDIVVEIVGFNHDDKADESGKAGISIITKELMPTDAQMATNQDYGYGGSSILSTYLRKYINEDVFSALPTTLQPHIKEVVKKANQPKSTTVKNYTDKLWIPSASEMLADHNIAWISKNGALYERFSNGNVSTSRFPPNKSGFYTYWYRDAYTVGRSVYYQTASSKLDKQASTNRAYYLFGFCI